LGGLWALEWAWHSAETEERYSRVPRLSDTRYSAKGTNGKWRYASRKARCVKKN